MSKAVLIPLCMLAIGLPHAAAEGATLETARIEELTGATGKLDERLHSWGVGAPQALAKGLKAALDTQRHPD